MTYKVVTLKSKNQTPMSCDNIFWNPTAGCFNSYEDAATFSSFEAAQPTAQKLREETPYFVYAIYL